MKTHLLSLIAIASPLLFAPGVAFAAPPNDYFSNAIVIYGTYGQADGSTVGSTSEPGEPPYRFGSSGGGIWYKWTSPNSIGRITISLQVFNDENYYYGAHELHAYQDVTGSVYDLIALGNFRVSGGAVGSQSFYVSPNTAYYFRSNYTSSNFPSPIQFTLNFSPIYRTGVSFRSPSGTLRGKRATVKAKVLSPSNASSVRVFASGKGRASKVRYNGSNVTFTHNRVGRAPKGRRAIARSKVTYTVIAYKAGQESGRASKRFSVR